MNKRRLTAVIFLRKNWSKSSNNGIVYNRVGFRCICATVSRQYTELFYNFFTRATVSRRSLGCWNFRNFPTINVPKCRGRKFFVLWRETFKVVRFLLSETWSLLFCYGHCWSPEHSHSGKTKSQRKFNHNSSVSDNAKNRDLPRKWRIWSCIL